MSEISKLAEMMRDEWNRRVDHDYRFWMSDGYSSDEVMWQAGERDFGIITKGLADTKEKTILELGCGVGRLLHAAIPVYHKVIGVDVSTSALHKADELLGKHDNLQLIAGNGIDLSEIPSSSIDVLFSFAAITSVPTEVIAGYLREMHRVMKPEGVVRLQVYLGEEQVVGRNDTLHLRCFDPDNFKNAVLLAGLEVEWIEELILPFQVSFEEAGIEAKIVSLRKGERPPALAEEISRTLLPSGEGSETDPITGVEVEYWMSLNYAKELLESGDFDKAKETLEYATKHFQTTSLDVRDLLDRIVSEIENRDAKPHQPVEVTSFNLQGYGHLEEGEVYERNLKILSDRFPEVFASFQKQTLTDAHSLEVLSTEQGPVISYTGQCLDHPTKPVSAAEAWAKRTLGEGKNREVHSLVTYGLGAGYHLDALCDQSSQELSLIEPSWSVFAQALKIRSAEKWLLRCKNLSVGETPDTSFLQGETELLIRPQTQAVFGEISANVRSKFYGARGLAKLSPSITVLGPISGGTLPILDYCRRGLSSLHQRVREVDMSCFAGGFNGIEGLVKDDIRQRVARGKYTEMLSELVLEIADEKPMDILLCMAQAPITSTALTELRKRGVITVLWFVEDYLRFPVWRYMAPFYDFIFTIQRGDCLKAIKAAGAGEV
ncbi:MAG: methyltransferase domain-containing protein, partial [Bdellovibrionales bacterium]|nr:methyltransferase domain-containing protein [Bdellovibrionales bacterium]